MITSTETMILRPLLGRILLNVQSPFKMERLHPQSTHDEKIVMAADMYICIATWLLALPNHTIVVLLVQQPKQRWRWLGERRGGTSDQMSMAEMIKRYE